MLTRKQAEPLCSVETYHRGLMTWMMPWKSFCLVVLQLSPVQPSRTPIPTPRLSPYASPMIDILYLE